MTQDWFEKLSDTQNDGWLMWGLKNIAVGIVCIVMVCITLVMGAAVEWYRFAIFPYIFAVLFYGGGGLYILLRVLFWIKEHTWDKFAKHRRKAWEYRKREDYYKDDNYRRGNWRD